MKYLFICSDCQKNSHDGEKWETLGINHKNKGDIALSDKLCPKCREEWIKRELGDDYKEGEKK